jgi:hypothetical protein
MGMRSARAAGYLHVVDVKGLPGHPHRGDPRILAYISRILEHSTVRDVREDTPSGPGPSLTGLLL